MKIILILLYSIFSYGSDFKIEKIISIYDGDTIKVNINCKTEIFCKKISIRILGIDTPEIRGSDKNEKKLAYIARDFTVNFIKNSEKIYLKDCKKGKYFRLVCYIINENNQNLSSLILKTNLAHIYSGGTKQKW